MAQLSESQQILADKEAFYEQVTRMVRWFAIAIVVATFSSSQPQYGLFLIAAAIAALFNALRYSPLMRFKLFASRITTLVADNLLIAILLALSGGIHSPYFMFWVFTIISGAYWYGQDGIVIVLTWQIGVSLALLLWHAPIAPGDTLRVSITEIFSLIALALLAERLTHADRSERSLLAEANRQAQTEEQRLKTLINSLADPVIAIDNNSRISIYNGAALGLLNTNEQLVGQDLDRFVHLEDDQSQVVELKGLLGQGQVVKRSDLSMKLPDGSTINLDISLAPIHSQGTTQPDSFILILRDITKQKTLDQEREEFIAVTSHELRTPVAIAEANLSTAMMPSFDTMGPRAGELVRQAHSNIVFLGELIADLSTLSKAEQGRLKLVYSSVDPSSLVQQLAEDYHNQAALQHITIKSEASKDLHPFLTDVSILHEVLQNFLTNAIKYTDKGSVTIAAKAGAGAKSVIFSVIDTGIGISTSDQKKLFTKFYRSEDYRTRKTSGTGLGLYISFKLAERLGGKIGFKSRLNSGSTFSIELPADTVRAPNHSVKTALKQFVEG